MQNMVAYKIARIAWDACKQAEDFAIVNWEGRVVKVLWGIRGHDNVDHIFSSACMKLAFLECSSVPKLQQWALSMLLFHTAA